MTRSVFRFVDYIIQHEPLGEVTWEVFCATYGCEETSITDSDQRSSEWAMRHTAATGHALSRRVCTDHAKVRPA
ncbi:hypothetical protein [Streptomyces sp. NPDC057580]|uniref:DUF7848 domain-containing protein n=1 Tax=Streptomyces sp. NPDC057580 TaxID=3346173 RepID=UPI0036784DFF